MRWTSLVILSLSTLAAASPLRSTRYVVHETRERLPIGWQRESRLAGDVIIPVRIGLTQGDLHRGEDWLMAVSDPSSPQYGHHWTAEEVRKRFAPSDDSYTSVTSWLTSFSIPYKLDAQGWVHFKAPVAKVEELLQTKYYMYEHESGQLHIGCDAYSLPQDVHHHVDLIIPTLHWDVHAESTETPKQVKLRRLAKRSQMMKRSTPADLNKRSVGSMINSFGSGHTSTGARKLTAGDGRWIHRLNNPKYENVTNCDELITIHCLREMYGFGQNHNPMKNNSMGVVSFSPQNYLLEDLNNFFGNFSPALIGKEPILKSINGGKVTPLSKDWWYAVETNMNLQYAMSIVAPQNVTLFQVGDGIPEGKEEYNNFLNALDGSYCTFDGGNDPTRDAVYPNPAAGGYKGQKMCGTYEPTLVLSVSYGGNEADYTRRYITRQCNEFLKLGLMGVSVLFASGNFGVAGYGNQCRNPDGSLNDGANGRFTPDYPATCPYLTAVGGTYIPNGQTVWDKEHAWNVALPWSPGVNASSGGGWSDIFPMPAYQKTHVENYIANNVIPYTSAQYNNSGLTRAYPDVAANAWNYTYGIENVLDIIGGTSCATPTFASIVALLNQDRIYRKKSPLGFLNPVLYANPSLLTDITTGRNTGCGTNGFKAGPGWDPVTGLGTPHFNRMRSFLGNLP